MRRLMLAIAILAITAGGCRVRKKAAAKAVEDDGLVASVVNVAEPRTAAQLTRGFHSVEADAWRWTMKNFSVALHPPKGAAQNGATLQVSFSIPESAINRLGPMTLDARVNGVAVGSQTFSTAGEQAYRRDVPASALVNDVVAVDFTLDKGLPPTDQDARELGIVVSTVGLTAK